MHKPSKKIVWIWELYVLLAAALLTALSFLLFRFPIPSWIGWAFIGLWVLICAFFAAFYIPVAYHRMQYGIVDGKLVARSGVIYDSCITAAAQTSMRWQRILRTIMRRTMPELTKKPILHTKMELT